MTYMTKSPKKKLSLLLVFLLLVGCAGTLKQPIYMAPEFSSQVIDQITLLPALDFRIDKKINVNLQNQIQRAGAKNLDKRKYSVLISEDLGSVEQITEDDLKTADPTWIAQLGPTESRWVMVLCLIDVTTKLTFGSTGNAEVSGVLFDKENKTVVWRDKGIGRAGQGGLLGMAMKGTMDNEAISNAMYNLFASFPKRPKK
jgi:hypothetical protein